jgi:CotH protein/lamin tail-like protein/type IX secretion system substrate protein
MQIKYLFLLFSILFSSIIHAQTPFPNPGKVFNDEVLPKIYIEIDPGDFDAIIDPDNIGDDTHYPATFIFDNGTSRDTLENVGMRLRGNTSQAAQKKSFKLSFNTFEPGRKYKGLEKMNINGEHNDPSVIRSKLVWDLCRQMGIPASRSNHVLLYVNDEYKGLYINVEHVDEEFVQLRFGGELGNLYKCLYPATLEFWGTNPDTYKAESGGRRIYDLKTNTAEDDYSDLVQFIYILNTTSNENLPCELEKVFDVQNYLKVIAMDVLTANWDGPIFNKNNFYLYQNPQTGKMQYIPYDVDNTFGIQWFGEWTERNIYSWSPSGEPRPIYTKIMANSHYRAQYTYYLNQFLSLYFNESNFFDDIDSRKSLIEGAIPDDPLYPLDYGFTVNDFNNSYTQGLNVFHVPHGLKEYASLRMASAMDQLESTNAAPIITNVQQQVGNANQDIFISAKIEDESNVNATIEYAFNSQTGQAILYDDGQHNDGEANDEIFGGTIPAFNEQGTLEYYIQATDNESMSNRYPYCETYQVMISNSTVELYINEFQANNETTITDEAGEFDDWIEIYNAGNEPVNLGDFFLSDDLNNPTKWAFPDEMIQVGEFLLVWADGDEDQGIFHTNFGLNASGEAIVLSNSLGNAIDQVIFGEQQDDDATGRIPNGTGIMQFVTPTPAASNEPLSASEEIIIPAFEIYPNPFFDEIYISAEDVISRVQVSNLLGQPFLSEEKEANEFFISAPRLTPGIYLLTIQFENGMVVTRKVLKE